MAPSVNTSACKPIEWRLLMILSLVPTPIPKRNNKRKIENEVRIPTNFMILGLLPINRPMPIPNIIMANTMMMSSSIGDFVFEIGLETIFLQTK